MKYDSRTLEIVVFCTKTAQNDLKQALHTLNCFDDFVVLFVCIMVQHKAKRCAFRISGTYIPAAQKERTKKYPQYRLVKRKGE